MSTAMREVVVPRGRADAEGEVVLVVAGAKAGGIDAAGQVGRNR